MLVSFFVFVGVLRFVIRARNQQPPWVQIASVGFLVAVGGMLFAKFGATTGWPWWIYYTVPMLLTVFFPPLFFKMNRKETLFYLLLSFLSAPAIHVVFSFFLGWRNYMPFIEIPALWELL